MTAKKIGGWIEQNANTVVGALVSAMLIANITLYAVNEGLKSTVNSNEKRLEAAKIP